MGLYDDPFYYDIAFSFRNFPAEVDVFETLIGRHSGRPVKRILEIACGNAPHLEEIARRGYEFVGVDRDRNMLAFSRKKAEQAGIDAQFVRSDIRDFKIDPPADFAFVAVGSLYVENTEDLERHFSCMAKALEPGGLYVLDWCVSLSPLLEHIDRWSMRRKDVRMQCMFRQVVIDPIAQLAEERVVLDVNHSGKEFTIEETLRRRLIFPQEFLLMMRHSPDFEFVGWWNHFDPDEPLVWEPDGDCSRILTAVRRRGGDARTLL
jgi:SAM-dependent methyltransferase